MSDPAASLTARRGDRSGRRWPPSLAAALGTGFVVWGVVIGVERLSDNSFFTHLATGRLILADGIPTADPYSYTAPGEPWVVQSWLASLVYGLVDRAADGLGLRVLTGVLAGTVAGLAWHLTRRAGGLVPRVVITGLVVAIGATFWSPRPLLFGLVLLGFVLVVVEDDLDPRWLAPALWLWVQLHGSWPLGLVALGALALGRRLDGERPTVELRALAWAAGGAAVGAVVNPLGPRLGLFPLSLLSRTEVLSEIIEWQSPEFSVLWARLFLVQVAVAVLALARRPSYRAAVPLVIFVAAALLGLRNVPVASLVLVPGTAAGLAGLGSITGRQRTPATGLVAVALAVVGALTATVALSRPHYDLTTFPVDALAYADRAGLVAPDVRLLTQETVGNHLELAVGPDRVQVFLDDRVDMYPVPVIEDYLTVLRGRPGWDDVLDRWEVDAIVWPRGEPLEALLADDERWVRSYEDPTTFIACRRASGVCPTGAGA